MASSSAAGTSGTKESSLATLISFLDSRNVAYFYKVMTMTAVTPNVLGPIAYALEFPVRFVRAHGTRNIGELATFQPTNCGQTWPIKITVKDEPLQKHRVFAYGPGGWKAFVEDNNIQVGDTLVFSLVGVSRFLIDIIKAAPVEDHVHEEEEDPSLDPLSSPENIQGAWVPCKRCRKAPVAPRFLKNLGPRDIKKLGVPGKFWECFPAMLQSRDLELKGPNGVAMMVEAEGTFYETEQELDMHLKSGWKEFFIANDLRVHDVLEFSLVGPDTFTVDVQRV